MPTNDPDPSFIEGVREGIADSEAGRVSSLEDVVERLKPVPDEAKLETTHAFRAPRACYECGHPVEDHTPPADEPSVPDVAKLQTELAEGDVDLRVAQLQKELNTALEELEYVSHVAQDSSEALIRGHHALDAMRGQVRALVGVLRRVVPRPFHCEDCGYFVGSDEDGCCFTCGADLEISDFDLAIAAVEEERRNE